MPLTPGTRIGAYEVTGSLGAGGMGEVYRARDTRLNREVALKVLPEAFTADPDRLARFEREARVLASLNHPNIGGIHGLEESGDTRALVLELVEGPTLADRITQGPIPRSDAVSIATQIAEALEAAHEQGVIHRDLKPANIKVRPDGTVKVLDFGLAKAFEPEVAADPNLSLSPTVSLTAAATQMGMVIGTAAYMSPEQAKGQVVDKRADVWSFGVVLFEMLTGERPFKADDVSLTLARVLDREPDWVELDADLPPSLRVFLERCLAKDPKERVRDIGDVRLALAGAFDTTVAAPPESLGGQQPPAWQRPAALLLAGVALAALTGAAVWQLKPQSMQRSPVRFSIPPPTPGVVQLSNTLRDVAITPDGRRIVYSAGGGNPLQLYVRVLEELVAVPLAGLDDRVYGPAVSGDGAWISYFDRNDDTLNKVSILGGPSLRLCSMNGTQEGASWGDDIIIFGTRTPGGLWRVSADGGEPEELTTPDADRGEVNHAWPHMLPGGRAVLFTIMPEGGLSGAQIAVLDLETGDQTVLVPGGSDARYVHSGHIVYGTGGTLRAVGFDLDRLAVTTSPIPVLDGVNTKQRGGAANFDVSRDGTLVYVPVGGGTAGGESTLVWVNRDGSEEPLGVPADHYFRPRVSPDGAMVAVEIRDPISGTSAVWTVDVTRATRSILTREAGAASRPTWNREGTHLVFRFEGAGAGAGLFRTPADGTGEAELLLEEERSYTQLESDDWSSDGSELLVTYAAPGLDRDVGVLLLGDDGALRPLVSSDAAEGLAALSPDGGWIAYSSDETGRRDVYIARFPDLRDRTPISTDGGRDVRWSADGRELFYRSPDGLRMMAVPVSTEPTLELGTPSVLFDSAAYHIGGGRHHDLAPDGRFLMIKPALAATASSAAPPEQVVVVQDWHSELERLVPLDP